METLSFFGEVGLTSTSANHIANLAKEAVRNCHQKLDNIRFHNETISLLVSGKEATVFKGADKSTLDQLPEVVSILSKANGLIAWLREAIKEKERLTKSVDDYEDVDALLQHKKKWEEFRLTLPKKAPYPTAEDIKKQWTVGEQEKYLSLEAEAAALGKFIHEDGALSMARISLMQRLQKPTSVDLNGSETVIHNYTPTVSLENVDEVFKNFQARYRTVQAELNGMKKRIDDAVAAEKLRIDTEYNDAKRQYDLKEHEFANELDAIERQEEITKQNMLKEIQNLKIVVPNRFKDLVEQLQKK